MTLCMNHSFNEGKNNKLLRRFSNINKTDKVLRYKEEICNNAIAKPFY